MLNFREMIGNVHGEIPVIFILAQLTEDQMGASGPW